MDNACPKAEDTPQSDVSATQQAAGHAIKFFGHAIGAAGNSTPNLFGKALIFSTEQIIAFGGNTIQKDGPENPFTPLNLAKTAIGLPVAAEVEVIAEGLLLAAGVEVAVSPLIIGGGIIAVSYGSIVVLDHVVDASLESFSDWRKSGGPAETQKAIDSYINGLDGVSPEIRNAARSQINSVYKSIDGLIDDISDLKNTPEGVTPENVRELWQYHRNRAIMDGAGGCLVKPDSIRNDAPVIPPSDFKPLQFGPKGEDLFKVLPLNHSSIAPGADEMGSRSEIKRIAVERTGLAANDPRNDIQTLLNENKWRPMGHLLILADGTVQGPEQGAIPFENNPRIAAGKNGETFGVMYAGQGVMNDAQASTFAQVADHLMQLRAQDGLPKDIEVIAGSTNTAELLNLPTPRGPLPNAETPQTTPQLQRRQNNSLGGF